MILLQNVAQGAMIQTIDPNFVVTSMQKIIGYNMMEYLRDGFNRLDFLIVVFVDLEYTFPSYNMRTNHFTF